MFGQNFSAVKLPAIRADSDVESRFVIGDKQMLFETWKSSVLQGRNLILTNSDIKYKRALVSNTVDGYGYITDPDVTASSIIVANTEGVGAVYITGSYVTGNNITFWFNQKNTGQYYVKYAILNL
ncbi:hypothetical protein [Enterocloster lavalensis]|uniref:hypothetical protein n=1 Tax=Enterocloster lavalensis TaxID=460384 RepID=UPI001D0730BF|nr:hypothetical protein [Enterocloster lavalensis]MCB6343617.1 hypothetical protein [Enterocloster lavalensis]